jgi:hypothetical protein
MSKFPAYGMAGIGIAAAIGFVFALSFLSNNVGINVGTDLTRQSSSEPSSLLLQKPEEAGLSDGDQAMMAKQRESDAAPSGESANLMMQSSVALPTLKSIVALDGTTGEAIGNVTSGMQFEADKPVFIRAELVNPNDVPIFDSIIALGVSSGEVENSNSTATMQRQSYEQATSFHGDISAGDSVKLELFWNPAKEGKYTILLFSIPPDNLTSASAREPMSSIPITVTD